MVPIWNEMVGCVIFPTKRIVTILSYDSELIEREKRLNLLNISEILINMTLMSLFMSIGYHIASFFAKENGNVSLALWLSYPGANCTLTVF